MWVIEFRSGSFFRGPRSASGGSLGESMRFQQENHAKAYLDRKAKWAWFNGAMPRTVESVLSEQRR